MNTIYHFLYGLVSTTELTILLLVVTVVFAVLIVAAIVRMYKLKAENKKLIENVDKEETDKSYKDFTDGHLYENN